MGSATVLTFEILRGATPTAERVLCFKVVVVLHSAEIIKSVPDRELVQKNNTMLFMFCPSSGIPIHVPGYGKHLQVPQPQHVLEVLEYSRIKINLCLQCHFLNSSWAKAAAP